jgi:hypothetical protein
MSEAAAAAPAATPTATSDAAPAAPGAAPGAPAKATETKAPESEWTPDSEKQFFELMKKSPYGKLKANGKEEVLDSPEKVRAALLDAARGRGATKVAAEAKQAKAEAAEAKRQAELMARALDGDDEALAALGRERPEARAQREKALAEIPPEVRELIEERNELARQLQEREAATRQEQAKRESERKRAQAEQARTDGLALARKLAEKLTAAGGAEAAEALLPYVVEQWEALLEVGLEAGVDVTEEHVIAAAQRAFEEDTSKRFERLQPKTFLSGALKRLEALPPDDVVAALSPAAAQKWARALARRITSSRTETQPRPASQSSVESKRIEPVAKLPPLSPFRFGR